jgi:hypothetical protein
VTISAPETSKSVNDEVDDVGKKLEELSMKPEPQSEPSNVAKSDKNLSEIHSEPVTVSSNVGVDADVKKTDPEPVFEPVSPTPLPEDTSKSSEDDFIEGDFFPVLFHFFSKVSATAALNT